MKHLFSALMSGVFLVLLTTACVKTELKPAPDPRPSQRVVNLVASTWEKNSNGSFECKFNDILGYYRDASTIHVYLVDTDGEKLISNGIFQFMNGSLWSSISGDELVISFTPEPNASDMPFVELELKIVFNE